MPVDARGRVTQVDDAFRRHVVVSQLAGPLEVLHVLGEGRGVLVRKVEGLTAGLVPATATLGRFRPAPWLARPSRHQHAPEPPPERHHLRRRAQAQTPYRRWSRWPSTAAPWPLATSSSAVRLPNDAIGY